MARGAAIALVVYHHVCMGLWTAGLPFWPEPGGTLYHALRPLRLPVLLFCSGLLVEGSLAGGAKRFAAKKVRRIGVPYVAWTVVFVALLFAFGRYSNSGRGDAQLSLNLVWGSSGPLQFLFWLLVAQLAYAAFRVVGLGPLVVAVLVAAAMLTTSAAGGLGALAQPLGTLLGLASGATFAATAGRVARLPPAALMTIACGAAVGLVVAGRWGAGPLSPAPVPAATLNVLGVVAAVTSAGLLARLPAGRPMGYLGRHALEILVAHTLAAAAVRAALLRAGGVRDAACHLIVGTAAGVGVPLLLGLAARRLRAGWLFGR